MAGVHPWVSRAALALLLASSRAEAQTETVTLSDWTVIQNTRFTPTTGGLILTGNRGYLRTKLHFVDFVLRLEYRLSDERSEAAVIIRGMFDQRRRPASGYRVVLGPSSEANHATAAVTGYRRNTKPASGIPTVAARPRTGEWHRLELRAEGDRVSVRLDDALASVVDGSELGAGPIALEAVRGTVEFRNLTVERDRPHCGEGGLAAAGTALKADTPGLVLPRIVADVKPAYTYEAMAKRVAGQVAVEAIVDKDGVVRTTCLSRTLDADLDAMALAAAKRWKFEPATLGGTPTAVVITIDLTFQLK